MLLRNNVADIREYFQHAKAEGNYVTDKSGVKMLELVSASFVADQPAIFGKVNQDYVDRELAWYESQSLNVNDIPGGPPAIWKQVADKDGFINSNYGWCIWSPMNGNQYNNAVAELKKNPESRRAVMIYTRPSMWNKYNIGGMSDFMCTNAVQYVGYKNDYAWQKYVLDLVADDLKVPAGSILWNAGSLHVYERHFDLIS